MRDRRKWAQLVAVAIAMLVTLGGCQVATDDVTQGQQAATTTTASCAKTPTAAGCKPQVPPQRPAGLPDCDNDPGACEAYCGVNPGFCSCVGSPTTSTSTPSSACICGFYPSYPGCGPKAPTCDVDPSACAPARTVFCEQPPADLPDCHQAPAECDAYCETHPGFCACGPASKDCISACYPAYWPPSGGNGIVGAVRYPTGSAPDEFMAGSLDTDPVCQDYDLAADGVPETCFIDDGTDGLVNIQRGDLLFYKLTEQSNPMLGLLIGSVRESYTHIAICTAAEEGRCTEVAESFMDPWLERGAGFASRAVQRRQNLRSIRLRHGVLNHLGGIYRHSPSAHCYPGSTDPECCTDFCVSSNACFGNFTEAACAQASCLWVPGGSGSGASCRPAAMETCLETSFDTCASAPGCMQSLKQLECLEHPERVSEDVGRYRERVTVLRAPTAEAGIALADWLQAHYTPGKNGSAPHYNLRGYDYPVESSQCAQFGFDAIIKARGEADVEELYEGPYPGALYRGQAFLDGTRAVLHEAYVHAVESTGYINSWWHFGISHGWGRRAAGQIAAQVIRCLTAPTDWSTGDLQSHYAPVLFLDQSPWLFYPQAYSGARPTFMEYDDDCSDYERDGRYGWIHAVGDADRDHDDHGFRADGHTTLDSSELGIPQSGYVRFGYGPVTPHRLADALRLSDWKPVVASSAPMPSCSETAAPVNGGVLQTVSILPEEPVHYGSWQPCTEYASGTELCAALHPKTPVCNGLFASPSDPYRQSGPWTVIESASCNGPLLAGQDPANTSVAVLCAPDGSCAAEGAACDQLSDCCNAGYMVCDGGTCQPRDDTRDFSASVQAADSWPAHTVQRVEITTTFTGGGNHIARAATPEPYSGDPCPTAGLSVTPRDYCEALEDRTNGGGEFTCLTLQRSRDGELWEYLRPGYDDTGAPVTPMFGEDLDDGDGCDWPIGTCGGYAAYADPRVPGANTITGWQLAVLCGPRHAEYHLAGWPMRFCGDGWTSDGTQGEDLEDCDDANDLAGDGCSPDCKLESWTGSADCAQFDNADCTSHAGCSLGGALDEPSSCEGSMDCGLVCADDFGACVDIGGCQLVSPHHTPSCGNGDTEPGEECDDGNHTGGDGCSGACAWELSHCSGEIAIRADDCSAFNDDPAMCNVGIRTRNAWTGESSTCVWGGGLSSLDTCVSLHCDFWTAEGEDWCALTDMNRDDQIVDCEAQPRSACLALPGCAWVLTPEENED